MQLWCGPGGVGVGEVSVCVSLPGQKLVAHYPRRLWGCCNVDEHMLMCRPFLSVFARAKLRGGGSRIERREDEENKRQLGSGGAFTG